MEDKKYKATLKAAPQLVEKYIRSGKIAVEDLVDLYDSHGIPPEVAAEAAASRGVQVTVPDDFYERITKMHQRPPAKEEGKRSPPVPPEEVVGLPPPPGRSSTRTSTSRSRGPGSSR